MLPLYLGDDDVTAYLFFLDDKTGTILKRVEVPTWKQVWPYTFFMTGNGSYIIAGSLKPN